MSSVKELLRGDVIDGSGTANYIPKFIDTNTIGNSAITDDGSTITLSTSSTERMRIDSTGNVGINTSSPTLYSGYTTLEISNVTNGAVINLSKGSTIVGQIFNDDNNFYLYSVKETAPMRFLTTPSGGVGTERMRITSGGVLKVSNSGITLYSPSAHEIQNNAENTSVLNSDHTGASPYGNAISFRNASPNNTTNWFLGCFDSTQQRMVVFSNGNVVNTNNSYGAISDVKTKENITDASPKLDDLLQVKVRNFNYIGDDKKQIGVIAQELEEVFPSMIDESPDFEEQEVTDEEGKVTTERVDLGTTTKSVKYSVFVPMLIKAMQEQQEIIEGLKVRIETLENK